jgi:alpha-amylase
MGSINLIFGCHSHQPAGNFGHVFESAYALAYKPFLDVLERFPAVCATLHYTGPLYDWFVEYRPEFIERLRGLVERGQIEIMGGAYYEPLLCAIPERDAIDQIRRMQDFCELQFGARPRGMWLTERVWEPSMPRILSKAGVEYTVVDDMHFKASGLRPEELFGYYVTEDEGHKVKVFPILERLRYTIPFQEVKHTIAYLREHATEDGGRCAVIHDDGEKFGVWPQTHESVYGEGWLEEFFQALTDNRDWIRCQRYEDYLAEQTSQGRTYITCASYREMMGWTLPTRMQHELHALEHDFAGQPEKLLYIRGGFWRNFLAKYPESNNMQKHMLRLSGRVDRMRDKKKHRKNGEFARAVRLLHEAQCNCAYWHGVFGGLYLNHLRTAIYERLIAADALLDGIEHGDEAWVSCEVTDFDADGLDEVILENSQIALYFSPSDGGSLFELDYKPVPFNFLNTLARREEAYHRDLFGGDVQLASEAAETKSIHDIVRVKERGLENYLVYDASRRVSLREHFHAAEPDADALWANAAEDLGHFATGAFDFETKKNRVLMSREALLANGAGPVRLCKSATLAGGASSVEIRYDIENRGDTPFEAFLAVEFAANVLAGDAPDRYFRSDCRELEQPAIAARARDAGLLHIAVVDRWKELEYAMRFSSPATVFRFPVHTVSQSEGGQERVYQGSVMIPVWQVALDGGARMQLDVIVSISRV